MRDLIILYAILLFVSINRQGRTNNRLVDLFVVKWKKNVACMAELETFQWQQQHKKIALGKTNAAYCLGGSIRGRDRAGKKDVFFN